MFLRKEQVSLVHEISVMFLSAGESDQAVAGASEEEILDFSNF